MAGAGLKSRAGLGVGLSGQVGEWEIVCIVADLNNFPQEVAWGQMIYLVGRGRSGREEPMGRTHHITLHDVGYLSKLAGKHIHRQNHNAESCQGGSVALPRNILTILYSGTVHKSVFQFAFLNCRGQDNRKRNSVLRPKLVANLRILLGFTGTLQNAAIM